MLGASSWGVCHIFTKGYLNIYTVVVIKTGALPPETGQKKKSGFHSALGTKQPHDLLQSQKRLHLIWQGWQD